MSDSLQFNGAQAVAAWSNQNAAQFTPLNGASQGLGAISLPVRPTGGELLSSITNFNTNQALPQLNSAMLTAPQSVNNAFIEAFQLVAQFVQQIVSQTVQAVLQALGIGSAPTSQSLQSTTSRMPSELQYFSDFLPLLREAGPIAKDVLLDLGQGLGGAASSLGSGIGAGISGIFSGVGSIFR